MIKLFSSQDEKASLWSYKNFTEDYYDDLVDIPLVSEPEIIISGKICHQRRDVGFYSNISEGYKYSGQIAKSFPFEQASILKDLMEFVNDELETNFNGVLVNSYANGEKYISAHSDSPTGLDKNNSMVASLAYGAIRKFRIRDKTSKKIVFDHPHEPCELLVMAGDFQKKFTHEIPIEKKIKDRRISLTFRCHEK